MRYENAWGGGIEMAAASHLKGIAVYVYEAQPGGGFRRIGTFEPPPTVTSAISGKRKEIRVVYQGGVHYDALEVPAGGTPGGGGSGGDGYGYGALNGAILRPEGGGIATYGSPSAAYASARGGGSTAPTSQPASLWELAGQIGPAPPSTLWAPPRSLL